MIVVEDLLAHFKMKIDEKKKFEIDFLLEEMENLKFPCAWEEEGEKSKGLATPTLLHTIQPIRIKEQSWNGTVKGKLATSHSFATELPAERSDKILFWLFWCFYSGFSLSLSLSLTSKSIHFCVRTSWKSSFSSFSLISMMSHREDFFFVIIFVSNQAEPIFLCNFSLLDFLKSFQFSLEA